LSFFAPVWLVTLCYGHLCFFIYASSKKQGAAMNSWADPELPELLAPAGSWDCAKAAVENGADAIYFGLDRFNARMRAHNFTLNDLPELMVFLHSRGVRGYVTLNTLVFPDELKSAAHYLRTLIAAGVDAAIVQDVGICRLIRQLSPDFPIHASTQMTVTSAAGVRFAQALGCNLVVLARECSLKEINKIQRQLKAECVEMPLETFVHGALCVAYSGQCLTSESLGGRSANRGECAQACRMPYELIADGQKVELGDRAYLLSPQDLSGLSVVGDLVEAGVSSLKIEGRLKTPEYVANVTRVYRQALDARQVQREAAGHAHPQPSKKDLYSLEMAFSRGLFTGWFQGIDNQTLVHARFGKKRGAYIGQISRIQKQHKDIQLVVETTTPVKPGDGLVIDAGNPDKEQGGRLYGVERRGKETFVSFGRNAIDMSGVSVGDRLWKTSDPELDKELRQTYAGDQPRFKRSLFLTLEGQAGEALSAIAQDVQGNTAQATSTTALAAAHTQPLTSDRLIQQFSRLGSSPFTLAHLENRIVGEVMIPVSELNQLRRDLVAQLMEMRSRPRPWALNPHASHRDLLPSDPLGSSKSVESKSIESKSIEPRALEPQLIALVRSLPQLQAALEFGIQTLYCEFENPVRYRDAVQQVAEFKAGVLADELLADELLADELNEIALFIAPPRITKPSEYYILEQVKKAGADGYLVRNYDQLEFFKGDRCIADFSLNIANAIAADYFKNAFGLERLSASYDLNVQQLQALLESAPPEWFEITIHQHMPMFHMEHCVFCAFLSEGTDFTNCGRPCDQHEVKLRDRTGTEHVLQADAGCRNTLFNGRAQTGAEFVSLLMQKGAKHFRVEFLDESSAEVAHTLAAYQQLLKGEISGSQLWRQLNLSSQLGVTRGTLEKAKEKARETPREKTKEKPREKAPR
jgi:U32 family peptidase